MIDVLPAFLAPGQNADEDTKIASNAYIHPFSNGVIFPDGVSFPPAIRAVYYQAVIFPIQKTYLSIYKHL